MSELAGRTAIAVLVPALDEVVGRWRAEHDPSAQRGVGAHITLLVPFRPTVEVEGTFAELREVFAGVRRQTFRLAHVGVFPYVTWLAPEPSSLFRDLTIELARRFPDCPPYRGAFGDPVPHLTVLDHSGDRADVSAVHQQVVETLTPRFPIEATLDEISLLAQDDAGQWSVHTTFPLAG
jgi:2'-5' RNA ligase